MTNLEDELGDIAAKARKGLAITVAQLATSTGLNTGEIESMEAYKFTPGREQVKKVAEALSLSPDKLADISADAYSPAAVSPRQAPALVEVVPVPMGAYAENSYVLGCAQTKLAAVIDPGGAVDVISERLAANGLTLAVILITHAHSDHIGGLKQLVAAWPSVRLVNSLVERDSITRGVKAEWEVAQDGIRQSLGNLSITPLSTPGHTPGSMCYLVDGVCFVGDTLFAGSIGRPSGHEIFQQMLAQIRAKVLSLPETTILFPGHGPATTVAEEKAHNPFF